ncbi:hypothetical protein FQZ97_916320 [compost metagenome]
MLAVWLSQILSNRLLASVILIFLLNPSYELRTALVRSPKRCAVWPHDGDIGFIAVTQHHLVPAPHLPCQYIDPAAGDMSQVDKAERVNDLAAPDVMKWPSRISVFPVRFPPMAVI